jgi:hypothetical protein
MNLKKPKMNLMVADLMKMLQMKNFHNIPVELLLTGLAVVRVLMGMFLYTYKDLLSVPNH